MAVEDIWLEEALTEDARSRSVQRVARVSGREPATSAGENYTSDIYRIGLEVVLGSGKTETRSVIVKELPVAGMNWEFLEGEDFYRTEIMLYKDILPELEDTLREQRVPPLWPAFLGMKENYLIFSDLKSKNYVINCRKRRLDLDHAMLAMRSIALFHAASVVARERGKLEVSRLRPTFLVRSSSGIRKFRSGSVKSLATTIIEHWGPEWKDIGERLLKKCSDWKEIEKLALVDTSRLNVLNHGDLWTTNIMFKYSKGLQTPIGVRFVDFQLAHYNSYGFDLLYMMGTSLPAGLRRRHTPQLLQAYQSMLATTLHSYGLPHLAPTLSGVQAELRRLHLYFMFVLISVLPISSSQVEKAFEVNKLVDDMEESAHNPNIYRGRYQEEVNEELLNWAKEGFF